MFQLHMTSSSRELNLAQSLFAFPHFRQLTARAFGLIRRAFLR
jgi:hypothetical protein